jgi:hypothetical protein
LSIELHGRWLVGLCVDWCPTGVRWNLLSALEIPGFGGSSTSGTRIRRLGTSPDHESESGPGELRVAHNACGPEELGKGTRWYC